jgi:hypothetical protein
MTWRGKKNFQTVSKTEILCTVWKKPSIKLQIVLTKLFGNTFTDGFEKKKPSINLYKTIWK